MANIHPTAIVSPKAELAADVTVGAYAIIEDDVTIDSGTTVAYHAFIASGARIGKNCFIHHSAVISNVPQDLKFKKEEKTYAEIGDETTIREFATVHRATKHSAFISGTNDGITCVGKNCLIMAYAHVAHDCSLGDHVIFSNGVQIGGHVTIEDYAIVGGLTAIHQFSLIGAHSMIGGSCKVVKDVPPFSLIGDIPCRFSGVNKVGLERRGFSAESITAVRNAYKAIYYSGMNVTEALAKIEASADFSFPEVKHVVEFIKRSQRGIIAR